MSILYGRVVDGAPLRTGGYYSDYRPEEMPLKPAGEPWPWQKQRRAPQYDQTTRRLLRLHRLASTSRRPGIIRAARRGPCLHCGLTRRLAPRGLCKPCYADLAVRESYPKLHRVRCDSKMTPETVRALRDDFARGVHPNQLADAYGLKPPTVYNIVARRLWRRV